MARTAPKYRRPLNPEQTEILHVLYRFRFATTDLIATYQHKNQAAAVFNRLRVLCEQEYLGRTFRSSYRLLGKPASYHLLPKAIRLLKKDPDYDPKVLHALFKDRTASEQFINHCLTVFQAYAQLSALYGTGFDLFTKSELAEFSYFPKNLPDAYISLKGSNKARTKHYVLVAFEDATPHFICIKRIKELIAHAEAGGWAEAMSRAPAVLIVCESLKQQKSLQPRIARAIHYADVEKPRFYLTNKAAITAISKADDAIWQMVTDPITMHSLLEM